MATLKRIALASGQQPNVSGGSSISVPYTILICPYAAVL
jgi:hypothetical protein